MAAGSVPVIPCSCSPVMGSGSLMPKLEPRFRTSRSVKSKSQLPSVPWGWGVEGEWRDGKPWVRGGVEGRQGREVQEAVGRGGVKVP